MIGKATFKTINKSAMKVPSVSLKVGTAMDIPKEVLTAAPK